MEKSNFDVEKFKKLNDDEKERYLYNLIAFGVATEEIIDDEATDEEV